MAKKKIVNLKLKVGDKIQISEGIFIKIIFHYNNITPLTTKNPPKKTENFVLFEGSSKWKIIEIKDNKVVMQEIGSTLQRNLTFDSLKQLVKPETKKK